MIYKPQYPHSRPDENANRSGGFSGLTSRVLETVHVVIVWNHIDPYRSVALKLHAQVIEYGSKLRRPLAIHTKEEEACFSSVKDPLKLNQIPGKQFHEYLPFFSGRTFTRANMPITQQLETPSTPSSLDPISLRDEFTMATERVKSLSNGLEERITARIEELVDLENKRAALDALMEERASKAKSKIVIDVGGKKFSTSRDTLLSNGDNFFSALLRGQHWQPDEDGSYFIDRNPKYFAIILDYLRTREMVLDHLTWREMECLCREFDFYQVDHPKEMIQKEMDALIKFTKGRANVHATTLNSKTTPRTKTP
ncbi:K+ channel tetramerization domain-containing protein [Planoprotostelium fungivorum]|uniref:K+ channel tetramerization domain-containing protein n=1 Tax=Planoprotostelium fungivorum TaxID=1890364 RepID=A0A2P6NMJ3_9EUKA|nr:K+ channel tetramerization domain-containing protein [Planoprotostelium fungivorum]